MADGKIFLSHSHRDNEMIDGLCSAFESALRRESIFCQTSKDERSFGYGESITGKVKEELQNAHAVLVLLTENSERSPWIHYEAGAGAAYGKKVIPVFLPGCHEDTTLYFRDAKGIDLRGYEDTEIYKLFRLVAVEIGGRYSEQDTREFSDKLKQTLVDRTDQVAAVCLKRDDDDGEPKVLLVRSLDENGDERSQGKQRLFPKCDPKINGRRVFSHNMAAMFAAITEAGVPITILHELEPFSHWKEEKQKKLCIKPLLAEPIDQNASNVVGIRPGREPDWFTFAKAWDAVAEGRDPEYQRQYQNTLTRAFDAFRRMKNIE
jgi:hypothetical protein